MKRTTTSSTSSPSKPLHTGPSAATLMLLRQIARTYTGKPVQPYSPTYYALN
ncbi:MAG: hypothetical protein LUI04_07100 [Porphyromonadaceae bacterium]|nr:hypothetical protein [Porphyromonadaceae bacterium]